LKEKTLELPPAVGYFAAFHTRESMIKQALFLFLAAFSTLAHADYKVGYLYKVDITDARPTQSAVGFKEIEFKVEQIADEDEDGDLGAYKEKKAGKAVIGPNGQLYLVDGHHFARALQKYGSKTMWVEILADFSDLSTTAFWAKMKSKKWVYLKDQAGNEITPANLPKTIAGLKNDPFRSLGWMVRKCGGYTDRKAPFQEFLWAEFLRQYISLPANASKAKWIAAVEAAVELARSDKASHLPGWTGRRSTCSEILHWLQG